MRTESSRIPQMEHAKPAILIVQNALVNLLALPAPPICCSRIRPARLNAMMASIIIIRSAPNARLGARNAHLIQSAHPARTAISSVNRLALLAAMTGSTSPMAPARPATQTARNAIPLPASYALTSWWYLKENASLLALQINSTTMAHAKSAAALAQLARLRILV